MQDYELKLVWKKNHKKWKKKNPKRFYIVL